MRYWVLGLPLQVSAWVRVCVGMLPQQLSSPPSEDCRTCPEWRVCCRLCIAMHSLTIVQLGQVHELVQKLDSPKRLSSQGLASECLQGASEASLERRAACASLNRTCSGMKLGLAVTPKGSTKSGINVFKRPKPASEEHDTRCWTYSKMAKSSKASFSD